MSDTKDMLALAVAMGIDATVITSGFHKGKIRTQGHIYCDPEYFNPSTEELLEWLLTKGFFKLMHQNYMIYYISKCDVYFEGENILEIALQVAKHINEGVSDD